MTAPTPVRADITVHGDPEGFDATVTVSADDPIFTGHYPEFPIYPGVCLIETAHLVARAEAARRGIPLTLAEIESSRFLSPVFPGDRLRITGTSTDLRYSIGISVIRASLPANEAARIRLRYRSGAA